MYVLMDLEWYEQKKKPLMLTQIAALTVDENWTPEDLFYSRICPKFLTGPTWHSPGGASRISSMPRPFEPYCWI